MDAPLAIDGPAPEPEPPAKLSLDLASDEELEAGEGGEGFSPRPHGLTAHPRDLARAARAAAKHGGSRKRGKAASMYAAHGGEEAAVAFRSAMQHLQKHFVKRWSTINFTHQARLREAYAMPAGGGGAAGRARGDSVAVIAATAAQVAERFSEDMRVLKAGSEGLSAPGKGGGGGAEGKLLARLRSDASKLQTALGNDAQGSQKRGKGKQPKDTPCLARLLFEVYTGHLQALMRRQHIATARLRTLARRGCSGAALMQARRASSVRLFPSSGARVSGLQSTRLGRGSGLQTERALVPDVHPPKRGLALQCACGARLDASRFCFAGAAVLDRARAAMRGPSAPQHPRERRRPPPGVLWPLSNVTLSCRNRPL